MITTNVIQRVFYLKNKQSTGTCFSLDIDERQYFITAKHLVSDLTAIDSIDLFYNGNWSSMKLDLILHSKDADITVFVISKLIPGTKLDARFKDSIYGQDLYFLGFPYNFYTEIGEVNRNFPVPVVKKGILASTQMGPSKNQFLIDGHNNPGFSGGPVVFKKQGSDEFIVAGVIHGYYHEHESVDGKLVPIKNSNSGLIIAYSIDSAINLIKENPNGTKVN